MRENSEYLEQYLEMRREAERQAAMQPGVLHAMSPEEFIHTIHELQVHQIELEMQNENLQVVHAQLTDAEALYFDLYDLAPVGYLSVSKEGLILESNLTADTLLGVPRSALNKRPLSKVIHKEDQDIYYRCRKQLFETGAPQQCELRLLKDGEKPFWARLQATLGAERTGGAPVCRLVLSDISEHKQTEEKLRESEEKFHSIFEASPVPMALNDDEQRITFLNPAFVQTFGYTLEDIPVIQDWWPKAYPDPDYRRWVADIWQARLEMAKRSGEEFQPMEVIVRCKDGTRRTVQITASSIAGSFNETYLVMLYDISERKQAEEKLKASQERIRQLAQHLETVREEEHTHFADELHDELGQILTAIKIDLATVAAECPGEVRLKEKIDGVQKLLSDGILGVHTLCRELRPGALDDLGLKEALDGLTEDWKQHNDAECLFSADIDAEVLTDKIRTAVFRIVQEALTNISNHAQASTVWINLVADEQTLRFSVADNGRGMEPSAESKLTSFGLLGIRERLEALGGELHIESSPGKGTRIEGTIPLLREE